MDVWERCRRLDAADPLAYLRDAFAWPNDRALIYFDGNSLGPPPHAAVQAVQEELTRWRDRLVGGWNDRWLALSDDAAQSIAALVGADPDTVVVTDSTSVCLSKLARAALRARPGRPDVVADRGNFPTDLYILRAAAEEAGGTVRLLDAEPDERAVARVLDDRVGLMSFSHVDFRSGALLDLPALTALAHDHDVWTLWDLAHSAGVVPVGFAAHGVDLAVGCTYKYLNGGPGAPAYLAVREDLIQRLEPVVPGWFGHAEPFAMESEYRPAPGAERFRSGTPPILSLAAMRAGASLVADAGIEALRAKSCALTDFAVELSDAWLAPLGMALATPRDPARRGSQVALRHPEARRITAMLLDACDVVPDFRQPDIVRLGLSPLVLRFADVAEGLRRLRDGVATEAYRSYPETLGRVT